MAKRRSRSRRRRTPRRVGLVLLALAVVALGFFLAGRIQRTVKRTLPRTPAARPATPAKRAPERARPAPSPPAEAPAGRIALVFDDFGRSLAEIEKVEALGIPVSFAVLPFESRTAEVVERLAARGHEILCHLPMEAEGGENPGRDAILEGQGAAEMAALTGRALDAVPGAVGVNNHMGSRITADAAAMRAILGVVGRRGLFFLDSRTTPESRAYDVARALDLASARRDVFLDPDADAATVRAEFARLLETARERGAAIGIAHPRPVTLAALAPEIAAAKREGWEFVPVSYLVERNEKLPD